MRSKSARCAGGALILSVAFAMAYPAAPKAVALIPADGVTWNRYLVINQAPIITNITANGFDLTSNIALGATTTYNWTYIVIGNL